ncbi:hypothetical protein [Persicitalea jodogahamensis]|uniref:Uncharacterized protein n=1 Tax=Persicitalea jodogahamensis TaxID=402147 RepID=A0A8J3G851_9BACT|nr:hypothetical protein [Persicitalea jodogahamensis]GHB61958.1 hypothetical protein GCM10007390_14830 [Persicitalea jodogahamensis]
MKKVVFATALYACLTTGWLLTSCDNNKDGKEEYAEEQADAINEADIARAEIRSADDTSDLADVREDLSEAAQELEAAKKEYMTELQNRQKSLSEKIGELDSKVTDPKQANREKWVEKRKELVQERDQLQANLLELQKPMTNDRFVTAEKEIKELLASIDKSLAD